MVKPKRSVKPGNTVMATVIMPMIAVTHSMEFAGLLLNMGRLVRSERNTKSSMRTDSINHPVWNSSSEMPGMLRSTKNVTQSKIVPTNPKKTMNRLMNVMSHFSGLFNCSGSTLSSATYIIGMSVSKLMINICNGAIGKLKSGLKNGNKKEAKANVTMLLKFALIVNWMYFIVLKKVFRPSLMPFATTPRSFSSKTMSAASFATSTALFTEMPTSAACKADTSLMPSPIYPTEYPAFFTALMTRSFWFGSTSAKMSMSSIWPTNASSMVSRSSGPEIAIGLEIPRSFPMDLAVNLLSPVMIFNSTPSVCRRLIVSGTPGFGGSERIMNPARIMSVSSAFVISSTPRMFLYATASNRYPSFAYFSYNCLTSFET